MGLPGRDDFYSVYTWMTSELRLSGAELALYAIIYGFTKPGSDQDYYGSLSYLATLSGFDRRSVIRCLQSLTQKGLLTKKTSTRNGVKFCEYRAVPPKGSDIVSPVVTLDVRGGDTVSPNNIVNNIKVSKDKSLDTGAQREAEFEVFWKAYPKKKDKAKARKSFFKVKTPLTTLLAALEAQKRTEQWQKDNGQFIPLPTTWLNGERWEDEVGPITTTPEPERPRRRVFKGTRINEYGEEENVYEWV